MGVPVIVALSQSEPVADDGRFAADCAPPRQQTQRNYPGSVLSFASGSEKKRITAGVEARRDRSPDKFRSAGLGLHPPGKVRFERKKEYSFAPASASWSHKNGRLRSVSQPLSENTCTPGSIRWCFGNSQQFSAEVVSEWFPVTLYTAI